MKSSNVANKFEGKNMRVKMKRYIRASERLFSEKISNSMMKDFFCESVKDII